LQRLLVTLAPHPSPLPREREPVKHASTARVQWRGLWSPWQLSEKPLPVIRAGQGDYNVQEAQAKGIE